MEEVTVTKNEKYEGIVTIDGEKFDTANFSEIAKSQLNNILFVNEQILQKQNEIAVADSARIMYKSVLKTELQNS
jgi:hypothetical protein